MNNEMLKARESYQKDHERLMPHIDSIIGQLTNKVNSNVISFEDVFYILAKTMQYSAEGMYAERDPYIQDIEDCMNLITTCVLPGLPDEDRNFMMPRLVLLSTSIIEYVNWNSHLKMTIEPEFE